MDQLEHQGNTPPFVGSDLFHPVSLRGQGGERRLPADIVREENPLLCMVLLIPCFVTAQIILVLLPKLVTIDVVKLLKAIAANGVIVQIILLKNPRNFWCNAFLQQPNPNLGSLLFLLIL